MLNGETRKMDHFEIHGNHDFVILVFVLISMDFEMMPKNWMGPHKTIYMEFHTMYHDEEIVVDSIHRFELREFSKQIILAEITNF